MTLALAVLACTEPKDEPGAAPEPVWPHWAWRHWVWEDESTEESALALVDDYLARDIDVGAIIIDSPWATGYSTFDWDAARYPDPQGMVDALHDRGVRVLVWTVPMINTDCPEGLYEEAVEKGYVMLPGEGRPASPIEWWKGEGVLLDYFNPEAVAWWHGLLDRTLDLGIDGWKTDGADFSVISTPWSPGAGRVVERLEYSHAYYQDFHDVTRDRLGDDRILTARPADNYGLGLTGEGVAFAPQAITWAGLVGDQDADFTGLRAAMDNLWVSAELGYLAMGSDIGGYRDLDGVENGRTKEVFLRWAWQGALSPVMENGGGGEHRPWMWDQETEDIYRDLVNLHHALLPYLTEAGARAFADGVSLFTFQDRESYAYLLGPDLFVAPILAEGGSMSVTLPDGTWVWSAGDGRVLAGGTAHAMDLTLAEYPAFTRQGSDVEAVFADWADGRS